jgi:GNAT superfamily N-acetyltransferase
MGDAVRRVIRATRGRAPYFETIPEISDFNVLPSYRKRGIGSALMDAAEAKVAERFAVVGIGVGLYPDYGQAQRMYVRRGYLPDGRGLIYDGRQVPPMETIRNDDSATLMFTKRLR